MDRTKPDELTLTRSVQDLAKESAKYQRRRDCLSIGHLFTATDGYTHSGNVVCMRCGGCFSVKAVRDPSGHMGHMIVEL